MTKTTATAAPTYRSVLVGRARTVHAAPSDDPRHTICGSEGRGNRNSYVHSAAGEGVTCSKCVSKMGLAPKPRGFGPVQTREAKEQADNLALWGVEIQAAVTAGDVERVARIAKVIVEAAGNVADLASRAR